MGRVSDELMSIGSFSLLTGLSVGTLRHYDEIRLLRPAAVDEHSGYRRYADDQVDVGRRVRALRSAELSTAQIAAVLAGDEQTVRDLLAQHLAALDERTVHRRALLDELVPSTEVLTQDAVRSAADFRLVAVNLGVSSEEALATARDFWSELLGTDLADWGSGSQQVVLGTGDSIGFLNIRVRAADEPHRDDVAAFGLGVPDLDDTHRRALVAGAVEQYPPTDGEHMPRHSLITDPVGNRVVLWEGR